MGRPNRRLLAGMLASGTVAVAAVLALAFATPGWYTPVAEAVGVVAALAFLVLGLRWSFAVLADVYGD